MYSAITRTAAIILIVVILAAIIGIVAYILSAPPAAPSPTPTPTTSPSPSPSPTPSPSPSPSPTPTPTPTPTKPKITEIRIGMIEPLTGKYAVFGQEAVDAARLVIDIINNELGGVKSLGGAKLVLYVEDAGGSPDTASLAAEKLVSQYRPHIIIGAYISRLTAAVAEVTEREKIPLVMDALVDWLTEKGWQYVFRLAPKASVHGKTAVDFVFDMAAKYNVTINKVVVLHEDSVFGTTVASGALSELAWKGIADVLTIRYPYTITDFGPIISQIRDFKPDIIISVPYFHDGVLFAQAFKASGLYVKFIAGAGGCGYTDPDSIREAGIAVEYFTNTYSYDPYKPTEWNKKLVEAFKARYGKLPTEAGGIIFYSLFFVYEALEKAGEMFPEDPLNPDNLRTVFLSLDLTEENSIAAQLYPTGRIKLAPNGDNLYAGAVVLQVINQQPRLVWPRPEPGVTPVFPRPP